MPPPRRIPKKSETRLIPPREVREPSPPSYSSDDQDEETLLGRIKDLHQYSDRLFGDWLKQRDLLCDAMDIFVENEERERRERECEERERAREHEFEMRRKEQELKNSQLAAETQKRKATVEEEEEQEDDAEDKAKSRTWAKKLRANRPSDEEEFEIEDEEEIDDGDKTEFEYGDSSDDEEEDEDDDAGDQTEFEDDEEDTEDDDIKTKRELKRQKAMKDFQNTADDGKEKVMEETDSSDVSSTTDSEEEGDTEEEEESKALGIDEKVEENALKADSTGVGTEANGAVPLDEKKDVTSAGPTIAPKKKEFKLRDLIVPQRRSASSIAIKYLSEDIQRVVHGISTMTEATKTLVMRDPNLAEGWTVTIFSLAGYKRQLGNYFLPSSITKKPQS